MKLQAALEYLMTYGWAFAIIIIIVAAIIALNLTTPTTSLQTTCTFPGTFSCQNAYLYTNGLLVVRLQAISNYPVTVNAIGCNANETIANMNALPVNTYMIVSTSNTFTASCYRGSSIFTSDTGSVFYGYIIVNYTDSYTGLPFTSFGTLVAKVQRSS